MTPYEQQDARRAGLLLHNIEKAKDQIRQRVMEAPLGVHAVTVTEQKPMQWRAAQLMIEAGELLVLSSSRGETRRGPPAAGGRRRVRREVRVTLAGWDPVAREFRQDGERI